MESVAHLLDADDLEIIGSGPARPALSRWQVLLLVGAGGAIGAAARHLIAVLMPTISTPTLIELPRATLIVNVLGCLALGILTGLIEARPTLPRWVQPLVGTGVFGGFTTFSTVVLEGSAMMGADFPFLAFSYAAATIAGAILAAALGVLLGAMIGRRTAGSAAGSHGSRPEAADPQTAEPELAGPEEERP